MEYLLCYSKQRWDCSLLESCFQEVQRRTINKNHSSGVMEKQDRNGILRMARKI